MNKVPSLSELLYWALSNVFFLVISQFGGDKYTCPAFHKADVVFEYSNLYDKSMSIWVIQKGENSI